jgi:hypothetical protein
MHYISCALEERSVISDGTPEKKTDRKKLSIKYGNVA